MEKLRPIMFVGTCSDAGKSIINTGFCRIFKQDGYQPAPFKAQNMSLNSFATVDGLEIGRAQAVQAEACGIDCATDMNPVLLKPTTDKSSQVVLNGKPIGNQSARDYFLGNNRMGLFEESCKAFERLEQKYSPVVLEGAGSISEINLKHRDITNMRMAKAADAATYLVADIDRGGVFGSVYGSIMLLDDDERALMKGIVINKFRGDASLFEEGKQMLEELTGVPVVGVIPYYEDIFIEEEDSVSLDSKNKDCKADKVNVAVVLVQRISNFTDFNALEMHPDVNLYYTNKPSMLKDADIVILPGSKNSISDLQHLRETGMADAIVKASKAGKTVIGICGGYQMMGEEILDPLGLEGNQEKIIGLGLLPVTTVIEAEKVTEQCVFQFLQEEGDCEGYEIHMGNTSFIDEDNLALTNIRGKGADGCFVSDKCWGSYIHGILDNVPVINKLLEPYEKSDDSTFDFKAFKEENYDKLADHIRKYVDMDQIYEVLKR
ncbi:cobyric acid synthase [Puteibacter caeruleilacunae]|nr:cobyric acid synthase [Puteibacter caeruleilacunae]